MFTLRFDVDELDRDIRDMIDRLEDGLAVHSLIGLTLYERNMERFQKGSRSGRPGVGAIEPAHLDEPKEQERHPAPSRRPAPVDPSHGRCKPR